MSAAQRGLAQIALGILLACAVILASPSVATAEGPSSVANKIFTTYVSQSFAGPPFAPFQDCVRFTATTAELDACPGPGQLQEFPLFGSPLLSLWLATGMCVDSGLNINAIGTSVDGGAFGAVDAMGGFLIEITGLATFGLEGMLDPACVVPTGPSAPATNPYTAP